MDDSSFQLILHSGNSRSSSMEALECARNGKFEEAEKKLEEAEKELGEAHDAQTKLLVEEAQGAEMKPNILLVHAQDHFTAAMVNLDLSREIIHLYHMFLNK